METPEKKCSWRWIPESNKAKRTALLPDTGNGKKLISTKGQGKGKEIKEGS